MDTLAVALARVTPQDNLTRLRDALAASEREWYLQTRVLLQAQPAGARVCLVVDQCEEVFTLCQDPPSAGSLWMRCAMRPPSRTVRASSS